jgi:hypothetical protein
MGAPRSAERTAARDPSQVRGSGRISKVRLEFTNPRKRSHPRISIAQFEALEGPDLSAACPQQLEPEINLRP